MAKVEDYVDQGKTPLCYHCHVDAVAEVKDKSELEALNNKFFGECDNESVN
ncbi:hypothetical protein J7384_17165 [Endozoicomonas sp. G2_1]|uniref:hypothetical protein n=1 Tax=Endozoicomonas sp. G2_1 TaxID=2821091 RepID=UPI001ADCD888|nr:hypothetical protein [Endozoicomonas sp. G2_1]MBO9492095.1 hypothetical protein [Endozoicomonas sp. G2_1]